jgi:hypothetical protein
MAHRHHLRKVVPLVVARDASTMPRWCHYLDDVVSRTWWSGITTLADQCLDAPRPVSPVRSPTASRLSPVVTGYPRRCHHLDTVLPAPRATGATTSVICCHDLRTPVLKIVTPHHIERAVLAARFRRTSNVLYCGFRSRSPWIAKPAAPLRDPGRRGSSSRSQWFPDPLTRATVPVAVDRDPCRSGSRSRSPWFSTSVTRRTVPVTVDRHTCCTGSRSRSLWFPAAVTRFETAVAADQTRSGYRSITRIVPSALFRRKIRPSDVASKRTSPRAAAVLFCARFFS